MCETSKQHGNILYYTQPVNIIRTNNIQIANVHDVGAVRAQKRCTTVGGVFIVKIRIIADMNK